MHAQFHGVEGQARSNYCSEASSLHLDLLADTVRSKFNGGAQCSARYPLPCGWGFSWDSPRFDAGVSVKYSGKQDSVAAAETETGGFTNVDAQLAWRP